MVQLLVTHCIEPGRRLNACLQEILALCQQRRAEEAARDAEGAAAAREEEAAPGEDAEAVQGSSSSHGALGSAGSAIELGDAENAEVEGRGPAAAAARPRAAEGAAAEGHAHGGDGVDGAANVAQPRAVQGDAVGAGVDSDSDSDSGSYSRSDSDDDDDDDGLNDDFDHAERDDGGGLAMADEDDAEAGDLLNFDDLLDNDEGGLDFGHRDDFGLGVGVGVGLGVGDEVGGVDAASDDDDAASDDDDHDDDDDDDDGDGDDDEGDSDAASRASGDSGSSARVTPLVDAVTAALARWLSESDLDFLRVACATEVRAICSRHCATDRSVFDDTPLLLAAGHGHVGVVELLLADARVHPADAESRTAVLDEALAGGSIGVLERLLADPRVDPLVRDRKGRDALGRFAAMRESRPDAAITLLAQQPSVLRSRLALRSALWAGELRKIIVSAAQLRSLAWRRRMPVVAAHPLCRAMAGLEVTDND